MGASMTSTRQLRWSFMVWRQQYVQHDQPFVGVTWSRLLSGKWYPRCILVGGILYLPLWRLDSLEPRRSETFWLVVDLPLWKMMEFVSWDDEIPNIYGKIKKKSKPPTSVGNISHGAGRHLNGHCMWYGYNVGHWSSCSETGSKLVSSTKLIIKWDQLW